MLNALAKTHSLKLGERVIDLTFSPMGDKLAVCCESGKVQVYAAEGFDLLKEIETTAARCTCFSPSGKRLAVQRDQLVVELLDTTTWQPQQEFATGRVPHITCLAFSHSGDLLAAGGDCGTREQLGFVKIWDAESGRSVREIEDVEKVLRLGFYPGDTTLVSAGRRILLWDTETWEETSRLEYFMNPPATITPDGKRVLVFRRGYEVDLWDTQQGKIIWSVEELGIHPESLALAPGGVTVALGFVYFGSVYVWDTETDQELGITYAHSKATALKYSPDGQTLLSGHEDGEVAVWSTANARPARCVPSSSIVEIQESHSIKAHRSGAQVAYTPDGQYLMSGGGDDYLRIWNAETLEKLWSVRLPYWPHPVCTPDGQHVMALWDADLLRVWELENKKSFYEIPLPERQTITHLGFTPDGKNLITFGDSSGVNGHLYVWDVATWEIIRTEERKRGRCVSFVFTDNGRKFFAVERHGVSLWDVETLAEEIVLPSENLNFLQIEVTPDGQRLYTTAGMSVQNREVRIWDADYNLLGALWAASPRHNVLVLKVSPDGKTLATGNDESQIMLWDIATNEQKAILSGHTRAIISIDYSPDGRTLISGSRDGTFKLWDISAVC